MSLTNSWLNPLQRSYQDIKNALIEKMRLKMPEITDFSEGNIFIMIISIFSAITETLHYYIDGSAQEAFLPTARRYSSVIKHAKLVDYHIKSANPASVNVTISNDEPLVSDLTLSTQINFTDNNGNIWQNHKTVTWPSGSYSLTLALVDKAKVSETDITFGTIEYDDVSITINNIPSGKKYVEGSMVLYVGNEPWQLVDTFAYSNTESKVYKVEVNDNQVPTILFGDGIKGVKPLVGSTVVGNYYICNGVEGNIDSNSFSQVPSEISSILPNCTINNIYKASGGTDYEDFNSLKTNIPLSIKTLGVAITKDDFEAVTKLLPGVNKSYVDYKCGRYVDIYITPSEGGIASQALLTDTYNSLQKSKVITTVINIKPTLEVNVHLDATITGRPSYNTSDIENQVIKALVDNYNFNTSDINLPVRLSDIYSLIDQQNFVDYLTINSLYFIPNIIPKFDDESTPELKFATYQQLVFEWTNFESVEFTITIKAGNIATVSELYSNTNIDVPIGTSLRTLNFVFEGKVISFAVIIGSSDITYNEGDVYKFIVQDMNKDLIPNNFNIPIISSENLNLTINESV